MKTCPFQSVTDRTLLYKRVISDRLTCLICSLLRPEFVVGGGTGKPVGLRIVQSYQTEKGGLFSYKFTSFNHKEFTNLLKNILGVNTKSNKMFVGSQGTDCG